MAKRRYYAAYHYCGISFWNDVTEMHAFTSKAARDRFVSDELPGYRGNAHIESVTRREAERYMPTAFNGKEPWASYAWHDIDDVHSVYERTM